jgi:leader peptidase (prepilin peptidase)/N-methyltransferase
MFMAIVALVLLGFCFGSFINALIWRIHEQDKPKKKRAASDKELSIARGRSMCTHCKHELAAADLIPLFSWLLLRGKCRYCHHRIDDNPLVEAVLPVLFVLSYLVWPFGWSTHGVTGFVIWLAVLVGLVALFVYDLRWMLLPDRITYPLMLLLILYTLIRLVIFREGAHFALYVALSVIIAGGIFQVLYMASKGRWIGGGDTKLGLVIGLLLADPGKSLLMLFGASLLGTVYSLPFIITGKMKRTTHLPFGPFLIVATFVVYLFGRQILDWYGRVFIGL